MATTEILIERLRSDLSLRSLCGYEKIQQLPSQATFSLAFEEFSKSRLADIVHKSIVTEYLGEQLIGHVSRDSTAINAREKPLKKP